MRVSTVCIYTPDLSTGSRSGSVAFCTAIGNEHAISGEATFVCTKQWQARVIKWGNHRLFDLSPPSVTASSCFVINILNLSAFTSDKQIKVTAFKVT